MTRLCILITLVVLLLTGCLTAAGGKNETRNRFNRERFEERADRTVAVDGAASRIAMNIYQLPEVVQVNFPIGRGTRILSLTLSETERLNINRHLLWDREYVVDEDAGVLSVQFEIPAIYLLEQTVRFGLRIVAMDGRSKKITTSEKFLSFSWSPMKAGDGDALTFEYGGSELLKTQFSMQLRQELERTDIGRLSPVYGSKIRLLVQ